MDTTQKVSISKVPFVFGQPISMEHLRVAKESIKWITGAMKKIALNQKVVAQQKSMTDKYRLSFKNCKKQLETENKKNSDLTELASQGDVYLKYCSMLTKCSQDMKAFLEDVRVNQKEIKGLEADLADAEARYHNIDQDAKSLGNWSLIEKTTKDIGDLMHKIENCNLNIQKSLTSFAETKQLFVSMNDDTAQSTQLILEQLDEYSEICKNHVPSIVVLDLDGVKQDHTTDTEIASDHEDSSENDSIYDDNLPPPHVSITLLSPALDDEEENTVASYFQTAEAAM